MRRGARQMVGRRTCYMISADRNVASMIGRGSVPDSGTSAAPDHGTLAGKRCPSGAPGEGVIRSALWCRTADRLLFKVRFNTRHRATVIQSALWYPAAPTDSYSKCALVRRDGTLCVGALVKQSAKVRCRQQETTTVSCHRHRNMPGGKPSYSIGLW